MNDAVLEVVEGVRLTKLRAGSAENKRFHKLTDNYLKKFMKRAAGCFLQPLTVSSSHEYRHFVWIWSVCQQRRDYCRELITFNVYLNTDLPMFALGMLFNIMERGNASYDRIRAYWMKLT